MSGFRNPLLKGIPNPYSLHSSRVVSRADLSHHHKISSLCLFSAFSGSSRKISDPASCGVHVCNLSNLSSPSRSIAMNLMLAWTT